MTSAKSAITKVAAPRTAAASRNQAPLRSSTRVWLLLQLLVLLLPLLHPIAYVSAPRVTAVTLESVCVPLLESSQLTSLHCRMFCTRRNEHQPKSLFSSTCKCQLSIATCVNATLVESGMLHLRGDAVVVISNWSSMDHGNPLVYCCCLLQRFDKELYLNLRVDWYAVMDFAPGAGGVCR